MTKVFISYSRKDKVFAGRLTEALQKSELETWIDWEDIPPTADWLDQIHKGIEQADAFLFLLSPDSVASKVCGQEVDHAVQNGKRLIPIVTRDVNPNDVHTALAKVNWIYSRESDDFDIAVNKTLSAIRTDLAWVEAHKRLQVRAIEWERTHKENSFLLRGKDLQDAEQQLSIHATTEPQPTELQREYVLKSRQVADKQRRVLTTLSIAAAVVMLGLAIFGFNRAIEATNQGAVAQNNANTAMANEHIAQTAQVYAENQKTNAEQQKLAAEQAARKALAGKLAAEANSRMNSNYKLALILSTKAYELEPSFLTRTTLFDLLQFTPYIRLFGYNGDVYNLAVSPDGQVIAIASCAKYILMDRYNFVSSASPLGCKYGEITLTNSETHQLIRKIPGEFGKVSSLAFHQSGDMLLLAAGGDLPLLERYYDAISRDYQTGGQISIWNITNPTKTEPVLMSQVNQGVPISTIAFSHNGFWLVSGSSANGSVIPWDIHDLTKPIMGMFHQTFSWVYSIAFSNDDKTLVSAGVDGNAILWDTSQLEGTLPIKMNKVGPVRQQIEQSYSVAFSPDGKKIALGSGDVMILWNWDDSTRKLDSPQLLQAHDNNISSIAFNTDNTILASAGYDSNVILWDVNTYSQMGLPLRGHINAVNSIAFGSLDSGKSIFLVTSGEDRNVIQWDLSNYYPLSQVTTEATQPEGINTITTNGNFVAQVENEQQIVLNHQTLQNGHIGIVNSLQFGTLQDGTLLLASASDDQSVILWDVENISSDPMFLKMDRFDNPVKVAFFDRGQLITVEKNSERIIRWDIDPDTWVVRVCENIQLNGDQVKVWEELTGEKDYQSVCRATK